MYVCYYDLQCLYGLMTQSETSVMMQFTVQDLKIQSKNDNFKRVNNIYIYINMFHVVLTQFHLNGYFGMDISLSLYKHMQGEYVFLNTYIYP